MQHQPILIPTLTKSDFFIGFEQSIYRPVASVPLPFPLQFKTSTWRQSLS